MHNSTMFTRCEEEDELICHALLGCADSRDIWLTSPFLSIINGARVILLTISSCGSTPMSLRMSYLPFVRAGGPARFVKIRELWMTAHAVNQLSISLCKMVTEYSSYALKLSPVSRPSVQVFNSWQPPHEDYFKINFDA